MSLRVQERILPQLGIAVAYMFQKSSKQFEGVIKISGYGN